MAAFFLASLIVAFVGGLIALAMPCCFSVLLPSYFASAFKRRVAIIGMTLVFALGIAAVLVPITLAATAFTDWIRARHSVLFVAGGFLMVLFGLLAFWGKSVVPQFRLPVNLKDPGVANVFVLGVFSGIATSCCAPVLAGVIVLSALSPSLAATLALALAYVAGMVLPLFVAALLWDRRSAKGPSFLQGRMVRVPWPGGGLEVHSSNLVTGIIFLGMGLVTVALGVTDTMVVLPGSEMVGVYQIMVENVVSAALADPVARLLGWILVALLVAGTAFALWRRLSASSKGDSLDRSAQGPGALRPGGRGGT